MGLWRCVELPGAAWQRAGFVARGRTRALRRTRLSGHHPRNRRPGRVSHDLIFRYFDSKEGLFFESVGRPLLDAVDGLHRRWLDDPGLQSLDPKELAHRFTTDFYCFLSDNQAIARAMVHLFTEGPTGAELDVLRSRINDTLSAMLPRSTPCCPSTGSGALRRPCSSGSCCSSWVRSRHSCPRHISEMTTPRRERR
ncbi:hypothetical protein I553_4968 [Mycobacterium xenopi 4042]|uniref:Uncharacterized protein n=1 Tax=Mycobacterium xenopi 4042 TaxID=1299334 RepID=X8AHT4_MYCXE|nr:hypothetical protein I553_4968 [Mycobacterium xenopi 4042]